LLEFIVRLAKLVEALPTSRTGNHVAGQLLRCGTSPFANHGELQAAESRKDFIHKLGICFKELKEVRRLFYRAT
jgi:four helix bundle protein